MTNPYPGGTPYSTTPIPSFRRSSYASVAAGTASTNPPAHSPPSRSGGLSHLLHSEDLDRQRERERHASHHPVSGGVSTGLSTGQATSTLSRAGFSEKNNVDDILAITPAFLWPTYLRGSRHVERLEAEYKSQVAVATEVRRSGRHIYYSRDTHTPSLSTSSSSVNLHKPPSLFSKGPVQDVTERLAPARTEEPLRKLPTRWSEMDKCSGLELLKDGQEVRFQGVTKTTDEAATVRTDHPMPKEAGIYYFEVTVLSRGKEGLIGIGFSGPKVSLSRLPGWEPESWAYHGDDGFSFSQTSSGKHYGPKFAASNTIGCGVNFRKGTAFFTKDGVYLGDAFQGIRGDKLYPSVGMKKLGEHLRANFGAHPFVFDIDKMMQDERRLIQQEVDQQAITSISGSLDERSMIQELIGQYLAHDGYVETARAFADEVEEQRRSLSDYSSGVKIFDTSQDIHAINRQKIRGAILEGDIDTALKYSNTFYPHVLEREENRDVYFKLRCRKFIEMMRQCNGLQTAASTFQTSKATGKRPEKLAGLHKYNSSDTSMLDQQMELDDQIQRESKPPTVPPISIPPPLDADFSRSGQDGAAMDTAPDTLLPPSKPSKRSTMSEHDALLTEVLHYGRELQAEFGSDARSAVKQALSDIFALVAYTDARDSVVGALMEGQGRVEIAEEVNSAILVSLGKPSSAALEKLCAQTEVLIDLLSADGGPGAFMNVSRDCLR